MLGRLVSFALRAYLRTWGGSPIYIDIQSIQISLLAGRIFFGRVTYHGNNETILVVSGHITWRYWLRKVRHCTEEHGRKTSDLPCRILVKVQGLEWFVYNRSPAYDAIVTQMTAGDLSGITENSKDQHDHGKDGHNDNPLDMETTHTSRKVGPMSEKTTTSAKTQKPLANQLNSDKEEGVVGSTSQMDSAFIRLLPIRLECSKGGIVMGNNNTPSILVAHFSHADGSVDVSQVSDLFTT